MIGETLYTHDTNRRNYFNEDGTKRSSPNPDHYWRAHTVTGETRICWVLDNGLYKVDKKTLQLRGVREFYALSPYAFTAEQKEEALWREKNRSRIIDAVGRADTAILRKIDALLTSAD